MTNRSSIRAVRVDHENVFRLKQGTSHIRVARHAKASSLLEVPRAIRCLGAWNRQMRVANECVPGETQQRPVILSPAPQQQTC